MLISSKGVSGAFLHLGLIYLVLVLIGAQFLKTPTESDLIFIEQKDSENHQKESHLSKKQRCSFQ